MKWKLPLQPVVTVVGLTVVALSGFADESAKTVDYAIVVTGSELLNGVYPDGHTHFLTSTLRPLGLHCVGSLSVDDKPADIYDALRYATAHAKLVLVTGGLGPTDSDITRETLAEFTGIALHEHPQAIAELERRFDTTRDQLRANLRRQTQVPVKGGYLKNATGTAVGLVFESPDTTIVALPGPPRELQPMVRQELIPYLSRRFGTHALGCAITLRFVGIGQSAIDQVLEDHVDLPEDVMESTQFDASRVDFTFALPDDTPENRQRLERLKQQLVTQLGEYYYGEADVTLEEHVAGLLRDRGWKLSLAEIGSGGALSAAFNRSDVGHDVLGGSLIAPTVEAMATMLGQQGPPPQQDAGGLLSLAQSARTVTCSQWGLAIGGLTQTENGTPCIQVAHATPVGNEVRQLGLGDGKLDQAGLATQLLDQIRRMMCRKPN